MRALSTFESLYLSRSGNRLNEVVAQAVSGGARAPPGATEATNVSRAIAGELDAAKFDPMLVAGVAQKAKGSFEMLLARIDPMVPSTSCLATSFFDVKTTGCQRQMGDQLVRPCLHPSNGAKCSTGIIPIQLLDWPE